MKTALIALLAAALVACAPTRLLVDASRTDMNRYEADLADCRQIAGEAPGAGTGAAAGAVAGYLLGRVLAATLGARNSAPAGRASAIAGAVSGGAAGAKGESDVVRRCLQGRGHNPLN